MLLAPVLRAEARLAWTGRGNILEFQERLPRRRAETLESPRRGAAARNAMRSSPKGSFVSSPVSRLDLVDNMD